jgi:hypothetical protein
VACKPCHAVLDRHGLVKRMGKRHPHATGTPLSHGTAPNDLWCADRIAGTAIMSSLARLLDRAEKVPNLFVDMSESKTSEPLMKPGVT